MEGMGHGSRVRFLSGVASFAGCLCMMLNLRFWTLFISNFAANGPLKPFIREVFSY